MTTLFWAIWLAISVFIIGIFVWTTKALFEQKAAWRTFAERRKLKYLPTRFLSSPVIKGLIDGNDFYLASELRDSGDLRGRRFKTVMQFGLPMRMPAGAVVGSGDFVGFVRALDARDDLKLSFEGVPEGSVIGRSDNAEKIADYFTPERVKVLETLVKQKGVSVLFLFDDKYAYLRLETVDPMINATNLDKLVDRLLPMMKTMWA